MRVSHIPLRLATGAFILNSGLSKRSLAGEAAEGVHQMAASAVPPIQGMEPDTFAKVLSGSEMALGIALLTPTVSPRLAGAGLTAFAAGLLRLYWVTPGMREEHGIRPTQKGNALAKDVWLLGAGLALLVDGIIDGVKR
jgi:hypothetical protein